MHLPYKVIKILKFCPFNMTYIISTVSWMIDGGCNPYVKCAHSIHLSDILMQISKTAYLYTMAANCKNSDPLNRIDQAIVNFTEDVHN